MSFQSAVANQQGFGVPGEMFTDSPHIAKTYTIVSASAAYNIVGATGCAITSQGFCSAGASALTRNGTTTDTSTSISGLSATADLVVGSLVQGTGIPNGATIASITNSTTIVISIAATASGTVALIFTPPNLGFAGFLVNPKVYPLYGTTGNTLAPSLVLPNDGIVECLTMGTIVVTLPAAAEIGDLVVYNNTTGAISTIAPGAALADGTTFANAMVAYITPDAVGAQLAVIQVNPTYVIPQSA